MLKHMCDSLMDKFIPDNYYYGLNPMNDNFTLKFLMDAPGDNEAL